MNLKSLIVGLSLASTFLVSTFVEGAFAQRAIAPTRIPLFSHKCTGVDRTDEEVSSNRQLFTAIAHFGYSSIGGGARLLFTCRLDGRKRLARETLRFKLGTRDNAGYKANVTFGVYLDGVLTGGQDEMGNGEVKSILFDVTKVLNVAMEVNCNASSECPELYIFTAEIVPGTSSRIPAPKFLNAKLN